MTRPAVGEQELEVLRFVADHPDVTVREVFQQFGEPRGLARTTILTTMENLRTKGYLSRQKAEGLYRYAAVVAKPDLLRRLLSDFVQTTLKGSLSPFAAYLAEAEDVSDTELDELERVVERLRAERKKDTK